MFPYRTSLSTTKLEQSLNQLDQIRRILRRIRLRFPHLVTVSVSSSGLLLTKLDYKENPQVVAEALTTTDHDCNLVVSQVINTLELEETLGQPGKNKHL